MYSAELLARFLLPSINFLLLSGPQQISSYPNQDAQDQQNNLSTNTKKGVGKMENVWKAGTATLEITVQDH